MKELLNELIKKNIDFIHKILNDKDVLCKIRDILTYNCPKKERNKLIRELDSIAVENKIPDLNITINYTDTKILENFLKNINISRYFNKYKSLITTYSSWLYFEFGVGFPRTDATTFYSSGTIIDKYEFQFQLFLSEIAKLPGQQKKEIIDDIFGSMIDNIRGNQREIVYVNTRNKSPIHNNITFSYPEYATDTSYNTKSKKDRSHTSYITVTYDDNKPKEDDITQYIEMYNETLNNCKEKISSIKNYSDDNSLKEEFGLLENKIQKWLKNAESDLSKNIKKALDNLNDIAAETNKLYSEASNIKEKIDSIHQKCKNKLKEIKELSQDFEYIIKNDYHKDCDDIESRLENIENRKEFNKIIDEINNLYRNAYNRKHNKSSLSYVMDVEEDDEINLLEYI